MACCFRANASGDSVEEIQAAPDSPRSARTARHRQSTMNGQNQNATRYDSMETQNGYALISQDDTDNDDNKEPVSERDKTRKKTVDRARALLGLDPFVDPSEWSEDVDIDEDVYGAAIFSVIFDCFEIFTGKDEDGLELGINILRMTFVLVLLITNYVLQLGLLFWIYYFVALPQVHKVQFVYQAFHAEVFVDGVYSEELWHDFEHKESLCGIVFSNFPFMYAILCLWWTTMLDETRKNERMLRKIRQIRGTPKYEDMIVRGDGEDIPHRIVQLTPLVRGILYVVLLGPKMFIVVALTIIGTIWLAATDSFQDLILNAMALEFVISIDELLFNAMLPESIKVNIGLTKLVRPKPPMKTRAQHEKYVKWGYYRSCMYFGGTLSLVYLYMTYGQQVPIIGVLPGYVGDANCPSWLERHRTIMCKFGEECFPFH